MFYYIENGVITGHSEVFQEIGLESFESDEVLSIGMAYSDGEWIQYNNAAKIAALEASISARRWREALLGNEESIAFIADIDAKIEALR